MTNTSEINRTVERTGGGTNGIAMLLLLLALIAGCLLTVWAGIERENGLVIAGGGMAFVLAAIFVASGFYMVQPGSCRSPI